MFAYIYACWLDTFAPRWCAICKSKLSLSERVVCLVCKTDLPYLTSDYSIQNRVEMVFWGRVPAHSVTALLSYTKGSTVGNILHGLKYNGYQDYGVYLGKMLGNKLCKMDTLLSVDFVLAVPLHHLKHKKRGYNQAEIIAKEVAKILCIEYRDDILIKTHNNNSQTQKGRIDRWENATSSYCLKTSENLTNKHILIIDDVITTGATIEACCDVILKQFDAKISIAAAAYTYN